jgi:hypothetical protein
MAGGLINRPVFFASPSTSSPKRRHSRAGGNPVFIDPSRRWGDGKTELVGGLFFCRPQNAYFS